jgi:hypothetical protein
MMMKIVNWISNPVLPTWACAALKGSTHCRICWGCIGIVAGVILFAILLEGLL